MLLISKHLYFLKFVSLFIIIMFNEKLESSGLISLKIIPFPLNFREHFFGEWGNNVFTWSFCPKATKHFSGPLSAVFTLHDFAYLDACRV